MVQREEIAALERRIRDGNESERWAAAAALSEHVLASSDRIWAAVMHLASSGIEDVRQAVATNVLEHILEHHFDKYFPLIESEVQRGNENLRDSVRLCWKFGQSLDAQRSKRWDALVDRQKRAEGAIAAKHVATEPKRRTASNPKGKKKP